MPTPPHSPSPHTFAQLADGVATMARAEGAEVSVDDILHSAGRRTYGPLLLLIGLFSISPATIAPGMTWLAAALTLVLSLQLALGAHRPWLPRVLLGIRVSRRSVRVGADGMRAWSRRIDALLRPRLAFMTEPPFANFAGLACALAALVTFPFGLIPIAPLAPGLAVAFIGLGLFVRDGLLLLTGGLIMGAALWLTLAALP